MPWLVPVLAAHILTRGVTLLPGWLIRADPEAITSFLLAASAALRPSKRRDNFSVSAAVSTSHQPRVHLSVREKLSQPGVPAR